jgi:hypothetical protein
LSHQTATMSYHLIFTTETQDDLQQGFLWHEEKRASLGIDFMLSIEAVLKSIERNPFAYSLAPTSIPNIRRAVVPKFSYLIFYITSPYTPRIANHS